VDFQKDKIGFSGVQAEGEQKYEVELELFDEIVPEVSLICFLFSFSILEMPSTLYTSCHYLYHGKGQ
jgi:hypothetical protein